MVKYKIDHVTITWGIHTTDRIGSEMILETDPTAKKNNIFGDQCVDQYSV